MDRKISTSDTIFATVKSAGVTIARHTLSGCTSVADAVRRLCGLLRGAGLVTIELRNASLGWSQSRTFCLR